MIRLLLALALLVTAAAPLRAAEPVTVRAGLHEDYGRIVFDWPREVDYDARIEAGRLVVSFGEAAAFEGSVLRDGLKGYAAAAQASEDGRSLALPLSGAYDMKHFRLGTKVVIDLQQAAVPGAPQATAEAVQESLPRVRVRGGRHDGFSRLVFDWAEPVGEVLEEASGQARLIFDRPATFDTSAVNTARLPQIAALRTAPEGVTVEFAEGSRLRVDRSGTKVVLDVMPPPSATPAAAPESPAATETAPELPAATETASAEPAPAPQTVPEAAATPTGRPTPLVPQSMGGTAAAPPAAAPLPKIAESARGRLDIATDPIPGFLRSQAQGPRADAFEPVVLTFSWELPTTAAAFRRGDKIWLVFDRPAPPDAVRRIAEAVPHLGEVRMMEEAGATILQFAAPVTVAPRLSRDGGTWTVDLRPRSSLPEQALAAPVVEDEEGGRIRYPVIGAGRMLWVTDPDAGDRLVLVPIRGAGMGLTLPYGFPQFRSLQTQQGIVLQPLTAGIEVATVQTGVLVRDRNGLLVSKAEERRAAGRAADPSSDAPGLFELEEWRRGGIDLYQENRQALLRATTGVGGDRLAVARLDLARFYFAHGMESEALGVLQVIEDANPRLARDPEVSLMKGASQVMMRDYAAATATLAHPALDGEREALLWQAALAFQAEDWQAAATGFAATLDLIESYPRHLRLWLDLAAAESFMQAGDPEAAGRQLDHLQSRDLDARELAQVQVVRGMLASAAGDIEEAGKLWIEARDGSHRPSQARARLALIELGIAEETLSPQAAIEELERLRFAWRGDLFEFALLRKLADLYVGEKRHRDALYALREAVINFPDDPVARTSAQRMREIFAEIYSDPGDPEVPPLRALALFHEFMELTPAGPEGDLMIAGLADRLVEVDLLSRAAELLEGQVRYRLEGDDKVRIGARLALVHLLDRNPEASLEALDISEVEGADAALAGQRRQLRARALSDLNRTAEALELLADDESLDAEQLRSAIHWRERQWQEAVESLSKLIPLLPPRRPMEEEESQLVVNLAVALLLAGEVVELEDLNRRYGAAMARGPQADTFRLLVGDGERFELTSIADELSKVGQAQDFMASYRERLSRSNLSELN
ncbi:MAG: hypothetical protein ACFCUW_00380 [Kiloniellaceae bacterium]